MKKVNPFSPTFPVAPEYFANRNEVIKSFEKVLERSTGTSTPTPDNLAILGEWGLGKTSVLRKFESLLLGKEKRKNVFAATIELIPSACNSFVSFTRKFIDDVERNFVSSASLLMKMRKEIKNWRITSIGVGTALELERKIRERSPASVFEESLISLWQILKKQGISLAFLMIDDLHYLSERYPDGLYDLRGIFQGLPRHGCNFVLCVSGKGNFFTEIRELAEPLVRFFNLKHTLVPFNLEETKETINKPLKISASEISIEDDVIKQIHDLTQGHPFFIHFIMRELISLAEKPYISLQFFKKVYPSIQKIMVREKFEIDFSIASEKEREILLEISKIDFEEFSPSEIKIANVRSRLRDLLKKNLVVKNERGRYKLYHPLFKEYLRNLRR